jgi:hypothetical protein
VEAAAVVAVTVWAPVEEAETAAVTVVEATEPSNGTHRQRTGGA